jgi:hypothetical protein
MHAWLSCVQVDGLNAPIAPEAKLRKPERMEQQGRFAEAVGRFVKNTGNTRTKGTLSLCLTHFTSASRTALTSRRTPLAERPG